MMRPKKALATIAGLVLASCVAPDKPEYPSLQTDELHFFLKDDDGITRDYVMRTDTNGNRYYLNRETGERRTKK